MGFTKREPSGTSNLVFVSKGMLVQYVDGKQVTHDAFAGHILGFDFEIRKDFKGNEYEAVQLFMNDSDNTGVCICFPLESGYGAAFCKLIKNADLSKPVEISFSLDEKDGRKLTSTYMKQKNDAGEWVNLKWAYTESNPGKMPPAEKKTDRNGEYNDYTKRNAFFRNTLLLKGIAPALKKLYPDFDPGKAKQVVKDSSPADSTTEPIDDLPF